MNLTFLDQSYWWDILSALILLLCITGAAKRGAFRALSGMAGSVLGLLLGNHFQDGLAVFIEPVLQPMLRNLACKADLSRVTGLEAGSLLSDLVTQSVDLREKAGELYETLLTALADTLTASIAPILAFLIIFFLTKLAFRLVCGLLELDIPILSTLNRFAGGLLGALAGSLIILVLCWAVLRFAPEENVGLLSLHCLKQSYVGSLLLPFFTGTL